jgi:hypothetical protein
MIWDLLVIQLLLRVVLLMIVVFLEARRLYRRYCESRDILGAGKSKFFPGILFEILKLALCTHRGT